MTSTSLAGSQTPTASPIRGIGEPQRQIGDEGLGVSGAPVALPMLIGPIEIGNRHSQQTSAIGLTKRAGAGLCRGRGSQAHQQHRGREGEQTEAHGPAPSSGIGTSVTRRRAPSPANLDRRRSQAEPGRQAPALVEEEGPAVPAGEVEWTAGEQHDRGSARATERPRHFPVAAAVNEEQVAAEWRVVEGIEPRPGRGQHCSVRQPDIAVEDDRRVKQARAVRDGRRNSGHRRRRLEPRADAGPRLILDRRHGARPLQFEEAGFEHLQQVGLGDRPGLAADAQVLGCRGHLGQDRKRYRDRDGRYPSEGSAHGAGSSGPTRGPSKPSHGRSGNATASARMRSRGTNPISA